MPVPPPPSADRPPIPEIEPVVRDGVRYDQVVGGDADGQTGGVLAAFDAASGRELWRLRVYDNRRRAGLEGDVQDIFFASMSFAADGRLLIVNEIGQKFAVDVTRRSASPAP